MFKKTLRIQLGGGKIRIGRIIRKDPPTNSRRCRNRRDIFSKLKLLPDQQTIAPLAMVNLKYLA